MALFRRIRDYAREYQQRQEKARREGYRSYGAKRYAQEAPTREAQRQRTRLEKPRRKETERERLERQAVTNYRQKFGTRAVPTVSKGVRWLSLDELREVGSASRSRLQRLARREPYLIRDGKELNPYWYH